MSKLVRNEFEWIKFARFGVENILSFLDGKDMLMKYSLVSKTWKRLNVIDSQSLWRTKCEIDGIYSKGLVFSRRFQKLLQESL